MMTVDQTPLPERVAKSFSLLSAAAKDLNSISDELGKSIAEIDFALKKLNLGVIVWVPIHKNDGLPLESWYWSEDVGYAKIGSNWGICLRKVSGDTETPFDDVVESWLFSEAPRVLRIAAIEKIPDLLEKLSEQALKTTNDIRARLSDANAVAEAVKRAANVPRAPLRIQAQASKDAKPPLISTQPVADASSGVSFVDSLRNAVSAALITEGHNSAGQLLRVAAWKQDGSSLRIEVPGVGKKMLSLTVNAAAEKIIRQELQRLGAPSRFMVVPDTPTLASPFSSAVAEVEK
jgi:hypothetical protein